MEYQKVIHQKLKDPKLILYCCKNVLLILISRHFASLFVTSDFMVAGASDRPSNYVFV